MTKVEPSKITLTEDVATLRQMVLHLLASLEDERRRSADLEHQLASLKRRLFGPRSEKFDPGQLGLFAELAQQAASEGDTEQATSCETAEVASDANGGDKPKKRGHGRSRLPAPLPRERVEYHPSESQRTCPCYGKALRVIGEEVTEELDFVPASFVVRQHVRVKYACKVCQEKVVIAELPPRPIDKGRSGPGLLAHVLTSKYADHLPLNRLEGIFKRHGVNIARSTMCDWVRDAAALLAPIVAEMRRRVLESKKIHTDDTPVPVQDGSRKQTRNGYLWVYIGEKDDAVFDYTPTRSRDGPGVGLPRTSSNAGVSSRVVSAWERVRRSARVRLRSAASFILFVSLVNTGTTSSTSPTIA